jgi:hypothetical protein
MRVALADCRLATNRTRLVRKAKPTESFFNFFSPPQPISDDAIENGDLDEEELEEIESKLEVDYQIGEDFKEKVIRASSRIFFSDPPHPPRRSFHVPLTTLRAKLSNMT